MVRVERFIMIGSFDQLRSKYRRYIKEGLEDQMRFWWLKWIKPRRSPHFRTEAYSRYGYQRRRPKYQRRKENARRPHPLVMSGDAKRDIQRWIHVKGTSRLMKGEMQAPWYISMVPKATSKPIMGREVVAVAPVEIAELTQRLDAFMGQRLNSNRDRKVLKVA